MGCFLFFVGSLSVAKYTNDLEPHSGTDGTTQLYMSTRHDWPGFCLRKRRYLFSESATTELTVTKAFSRLTLILRRGETPFPPVSFASERNVTVYAVRSWSTMSSYAFWIWPIWLIG